MQKCRLKQAVFFLLKKQLKKIFYIFLLLIIFTYLCLPKK